MNVEKKMILLRRRMSWRNKRGESHFLAIILAAAFTVVVGTLIFNMLGKAARGKVEELTNNLSGKTSSNSIENGTDPHR